MLMLGEDKKMNNYFIEFQWLNSLEEDEKWEEARQYIWDLWKANKEDVNVLVRLGTECWYVLMLWDSEIYTSALNYQRFQENLIEVTQYGLERFSNNSLFLWTFGYMISMFPTLFYKGGEENSYLLWEKTGEEMLEKASRICSEDLIIRLLFYGTRKANKSYFMLRKSIQKLLPERFPGNSKIEKYFLEILSNQSCDTVQADDSSILTEK